MLKANNNDVSPTLLIIDGLELPVFKISSAIIGASLHIDNNKDVVWFLFTYPGLDLPLFNIFFIIYSYITFSFSKIILFSSTSCNNFSSITPSESSSNG